MQSHTVKEIQELESFLNNEQLKSVKDSPYTNVADQVRGFVYSIPFDSSFNFNSLPSDRIKSDNDPGETVNNGADADSDSDTSNTVVKPKVVTAEYNDEDFDEPSDTELNDEFSTKVKNDVTEYDPDDPTMINKMVKNRPVYTEIDKFFTFLEAARRSGAMLNYCERQYFTIPSSKNRPYLKLENTSTVHKFDPDVDALAITNDDPNDVDIPVKRSCIMLDFDFYQSIATRQIAETHCYSLAFCLVALMMDVFDFKTTENLTGEELDSHIAFTRKSEVMPVEHPKYGKCFKDGLHIIIFVKVTREVKDFFLRQIIERNLLSDIFTGVQLLHPINESLDRASTYVPVLFHGCSKSGKPPYELFAVYEAQTKVANAMNIPRVRSISDLDPGKSGVLKKISDPNDKKKKMEVLIPFELKYNLCHELSLHYESPNGLIKKKEVNANPKYKEEIRIHSERRDGRLISDNELQEIEYSINDLAVRFSEVKYLQKVLSLLAPHRVASYEEWKSVIIILARENQEYKPLAIWFSQRYARSWVKGGLSSLNKIWDWAISHPLTDESNMRRIGTLIEWAKQDNPDEMRKAQEQSTQMTILKFAMDTSGKLTDQNLADILYMLFRRKFVCDSNQFMVGPNSTIWFEFVLPSDKTDLEKGSVFKYRREANPDNLELYISRKLPAYIQNVNEWFTRRIESTTDDEAKQKYYAKVKANLNKTCERLGNASSASGILKKCKLVFRIRGFINHLDKDPNVIGVGNGVLKLYPTTELIQRYHDNPISRYTSVEYVKYDPTNPYVKEIEQAIKDLFAGEDDAHFFTMCYLASSLDGRNKNPLVYLWLGEGSNGKSFLLELHNNTLGSVVGGGYGTKMDVGFLTKERKAGGPDSEKMLLKHARFAYFSESDQGDYIKTGNIKEITGGENISAAEKFEKQDNFRVHCHFVVASNHDPRITGSDHGTWRRILVYRFKMKFCPFPDPNNPFEKKDNRKFADTVNRDPKYTEAYLSILGKYYEIVRDKYNYDLTQIPKPTIDRDTEKYRNEQDTINRFITDRIVFVGTVDSEGTPVDPVPIAEVSNKYIEWYRANIADVKLLTNDISAMFKHSSLKKYLQENHSGSFLTQHRILSRNENYDMKGNIVSKQQSPYKDNKVLNNPSNKLSPEEVNSISEIKNDLDLEEEIPITNPELEIIDDLDV